MLKKVFIIGMIVFLLAIFAPADVFAQCPMCKASVESAMHNEGNTRGLGLNHGILYLLSAPYILVMIVGFLWYRNHKKKQREDLYAELGID